MGELGSSAEAKGATPASSGDDTRPDGGGQG